MPTPMTTSALAGAGAMDQVPMLRAAAARAAIQRRECSEIFLKLSMFAFELKSCGRHEPYTVKICRLNPSAGVLQCCSVRRGRGPHVGHGRPLTTAPRKTEPSPPCRSLPYQHQRDSPNCGQGAKRGPQHDPPNCSAGSAAPELGLHITRSSELISPGKARSGITPLVRYNPEPLCRLPGHKVDNDHQDGTSTNRR